MPAKEVTDVLPHLFCLTSSLDDLSLLPALAEAGVDGFQVRDKAATTRELVALTRTVLDAVAAYDAVVVVDDRLDVALATGAHGVHLGGEDLAVGDARRIADAAAPGLVVGATCRDRAQVEAAAAAGADYAGFGPLFATSSKDGLPDPRGLDALAGATGVLPLIGIGGVDAPRASAARAAGAHGVAVIGALWRQPDPLTAAKELVAAVA
ncbi:thiamine phosphate synthase [Nocardioides sp. KR10-350]|uniref:thiamine phosphate synthase n=1 Tax=Nocardioides cheoyonin TaxID=3156615 RepID=UPI0032B5EB2D